MEAVPALVAAVGVKVAGRALVAAVWGKVAVRVNPDPAIAPSVPPLTTTSPVVPSQAKVAPGSSLKLKVMVAGCPLFSCATLLLIASVGARVSKLRLGVRPAPPVLPAGSV